MAQEFENRQGADPIFRQLRLQYEWFSRAKQFKLQLRASIRFPTSDSHGNPVKRSVDKHRFGGIMAKHDVTHHDLEQHVQTYCANTD